MFHVEHLVLLLSVFSTESFWLLSLWWCYLGRVLVPVEDVFLVFLSSFALFPCFIGWSSWGGVISDDPKLLPHGPDVCGGPINQNSDRKTNATYGKYHGEHIKQDFLLLGHWVISRHVFDH